MISNSHVYAYVLPYKQTKEEYQCTFHSGSLFNFFIAIIVACFQFKQCNFWSRSFIFTVLGSTFICWGNILYSYISKFVPSYIGVSVSQLFLVPTTMSFLVIYDKTFSIFHYIAFFGILMSAMLVSYTKKTEVAQKNNAFADGVQLGDGTAQV